MNIAVIDSRTKNIGDDIQTLSALRFCPEADFVVRDEIGSENRDLALIMNAWWAEGKSFPPKENIKPLPISMHLWDKKPFFKKPETIIWLKKNEPIGCRDLYTQNLLNGLSIKCYFSGCLTLTLPEYKGKRSGIVYVDYVPEEWKIKGALCLSHYNEVGDKLPVGERLKIAQDRLDIYKKAELVITKRLHVALPCIAMGTPVLVNQDVWASERFSGYSMPTVFKGIKYNYKVKRPTKLINNLEEKVNDFIKHIRQL